MQPSNDRQVAPGWVIRLLPGPPAFVHRYAVRRSNTLAAEDGLVWTDHGSFGTASEAEAYIGYCRAVDASQAAHDPASQSRYLSSAAWRAAGMPEGPQSGSQR